MNKLFCKVVNQKLTSLKHIFFRLNFHGDELYPLGGAELGAKLGAQAISHLEEVEFKGTERVNWPFILRWNPDSQQYP